jgi:hypothetical protein
MHERFPDVYGNLTPQVTTPFGLLMPSVPVALSFIYCFHVGLISVMLDVHRVHCDSRGPLTMIRVISPIGSGQSKYRNQ